MGFTSTTRTTDATRVVLASQIKKGMWLAYTDSRFNNRVVEVSKTRDGQVKLHTDYGNGGEPATQFFEPSDRVMVI